MTLILAGIGKMGTQIAKKLIESRNDVIAYDVNEQVLTQAAQEGVQTASTIKEAIATAQQTSSKVIVWLMIPAEYVSNELDKWLTELPAGSIVIDGGNTDFRQSALHAQLALQKQVHFLDIGTSGGVWGYTNGFSMMVGGDIQAYEAICPLLDILVQPSGMHKHFGANGSGHYVKMIHNAVEYGMMQSLAEGYQMLKEGPFSNINSATVADVWQHGSVVASWLNELTRQIMLENPQLEGVDGFVAESGETRWALEVAKEKGIPLPAIEAAFQVRLDSQSGKTNYATKLLAAMRHKFGGHTQNKL